MVPDQPDSIRHYQLAKHQKLVTGFSNHRRGKVFLTAVKIPDGSCQESVNRIA
jgi:hypothetical protein